MIWPYGLGEIWTPMNLIPRIKCTGQRGKWGVEKATCPLASTSISFYSCDQCLYCKSLSSISNFHSCDQITFYVLNFIHDTISPSFIHMTHLHCQLHPWTGLGGGGRRGGWEKVWERSHGDKQKKHKQGVCHIVALPFTLKSILRQKKNYGNSIISPCQNMIFNKSSKKKTKILQDII